MITYGLTALECPPEIEVWVLRNITYGRNSISVTGNGTINRFEGISDESIEEFRAIYKKNFNEEISKEEAFVKAHRLLNLYRTILGSPANK